MDSAVCSEHNPLLPEQGPAIRHQYRQQNSSASPTELYVTKSDSPKIGSRHSNVRAVKYAEAAVRPIWPEGQWLSQDASKHPTSQKELKACFYDI
jgi:hypothetical protein